MTNREIITKYASLPLFEWVGELSEIQIIDLEIIMSEARQDQMDRVENLLSNER